MSKIFGYITTTPTDDGDQQIEFHPIELQELEKEYSREMQERVKRAEEAIEYFRSYFKAPNNFAWTLPGDLVAIHIGMAMEGQENWKEILP